MVKAGWRRAGALLWLVVSTISAAAEGQRQVLDDPSDQDPVRIQPARRARGNAPEMPVQANADGSQIVKIRGAWGDYCLRTPSALPVGGGNPFGPETAVATTCPR